MAGPSLFPRAPAQPACSGAHGQHGNKVVHKSSEGRQIQGPTLGSCAPVQLGRESSFIDQSGARGGGEQHIRRLAQQTNHSGNRVANPSGGILQDNKEVRSSSHGLVRLNNQVTRFLSRCTEAQAGGTDALIVNWPQGLLYTFPPVALSPMVLQRMRALNLSDTSLATKTLVPGPGRALCHGAMELTAAQTGPCCTQGHNFTA